MPLGFHIDFGFSKQEDPSKVEQDLLKKIDQKYWRLMNHLLVYHGREVCSAAKPKCEKCTVYSYCKSKEKINKNEH